MSAFGDLIRAARQTHGISQKHLAETLGISPQYLCDIERGNRAPISPPLWRTLEVTLDLPYEAIRSAVWSVHEERDRAKVS